MLLGPSGRLAVSRHAVSVTHRHTHTVVRVPPLLSVSLCCDPSPSALIRVLCFDPSPSPGPGPLHVTVIRVPLLARSDHPPPPCRSVPSESPCPSSRSMRSRCTHSDNPPPVGPCSSLGLSAVTPWLQRGPTRPGLRLPAPGALSPPVCPPLPHATAAPR